MSLMVQEKTFEKFLSKQGSLARDNGFLARMLVTHPPTAKGSRFEWDNSEPSWDHLPKLTERLRELLDASISGVATSSQNHITLKLDYQAQEVWREFANEIEHAIRPEGFYADISDSASKAAEQAVRLAALFHVIENRSGDIEPGTLRQAICICKFYLSEFQRIFGRSSSLSPAIKDADELRNWLKMRFRDRGETKISRTHILQIGPARTRTIDRLEPALERLYETNEFYLKVEKGTRYIHGVFGRI